MFRVLDDNGQLDNFGRHPGDRPAEEEEHGGSKADDPSLTNSSSFPDAKRISRKNSWGIWCRRPAPESFSSVSFYADTTLHPLESDVLALVTLLYQLTPCPCAVWLLYA